MSSPKPLPYLPPELLGSVLSWVRRRSDLKNVMLTTKAMRDLAMPFLYSTVHLVIERCNREALEALLEAGHPGNQHIRTLVADCDGEAHNETSLKTLKALLQSIPQDRLAFFRCMFTANIDNQIMCLLASRQRRLEVLALGTMALDALSGQDHSPSVPLALQEWPSRVAHLVITWRIVSMDELRYCSALLDRSEETCKRLSIRTNTLGPSEKDSQGFDVLGLEGEAMRTLFQHCIGVEPRRQMNLECLSFSGQDFSSTTNDLCNAVNMPSLRELYIWECRQVDTLLARLIEIFGNEPSQLRKLVIGIKYSQPSPRLIRKLLQSLVGLEYLIVSHWCLSPEDTKFDVRCLETHKSSLKDLSIGTGENRNRETALYGLPEKDMEWLVANVRSLRQVALALPEISLQDALSDEWGGFGKAMACLATLEKLTVLRILTWPTADDTHTVFSDIDDVDGPRTREAYLRQLDTLATMIARFFNVTHRGSRLRRMAVLIFGNKERFDCVRNVDGWSIRMHVHGPVAYMLRATLNADGEFEHCAERVEAEMVMYEEPLGCVKSNDFDQGLGPGLFE
ncbi:hypothetical protein LTR85_006541 [Meristemomyces frigidus]|nr:hypothetical protein LTR85_006541 [Meristemomyces frigidus]